MALFLERVGQFSFRRRAWVAFAWLIVLVAVVYAAMGAPTAPPSSSSIPGAEFQQANTLIESGFHANPNGATAQIVFVAPKGQLITSARYRSVISSVLAQAAHSPQVADTSNPFRGGEVSRDGTTAIGTINYLVVSDSLKSSTTKVLESAVQVGRHDGLTIEIGGDALAQQASDKAIFVSLAIAAIILFITFGAFAAAGLPLLTAMVGVGVSLMAIIALGRSLGLSSATQSLGLMLGLAVGIDYALLIVSRYREERARGRDPLEAVGRATGTAGTAVVFAGLTVIIALGSLAVIGIPEATKMGLTAAATVAVAVLVALTLLPALLGFFPSAVVGRRARRAAKSISDDGSNARPNAGTRWAGFVQRHAVVMLLLAVTTLGVIALPAIHLRLGEQGNAGLSTATTQRRAYDDVSRAFGPGYNGQLTVVVSIGSAKDPHAAADAIAQQLRTTPGVISTSSPQFDAAGNLAIINVLPSASPDSSQASALVRAIRAERPSIEGTTGATFLVTGLTAANIDIAQKVSGALPIYLMTIVLLGFLLLLLVFRSILVPLKAVLGFVLSIFAGLGATVAVFQWGWLNRVLGVPTTGPIQSLIPIFLIGISFGLSMDYEVFLVTRICGAHDHGEEPRHAVQSGFGYSARVVVAAALIMTSVFSGFIFNGDVLVKMIGFGLAVTILLDAFIDRMTIGPAVLALLGKAAWWRPRWIEKALPDLDIEGQSLDSPSHIKSHKLDDPGTPPRIEYLHPDLESHTLKSWTTTRGHNREDTD